MRRRLAPLALLLIPLVAVAETEMRFAYYRDPAIAIEPGGLGDFLNSYIGACRGFFDGQRCKDAAASFRAEHEGKPHWATIREGEADMLQMLAFDPKTGNYTLRITPAFFGGGYLLTQGKPERTDDEGNPLFRVIDLPMTLRRGQTPMQVSKALSDKIMRVQVIFTPRESWQLGTEVVPKFGVAADLHAILITVGASGDKYASWYEEKAAKKPEFKPEAAAEPVKKKKK